MRRRDVMTAGAGLLAAAAFGPGARAQTAWPDKNKTVKVVVPWPPGAANDALGRVLSQRIQDTFGVTSIVENRVGGAGLVGTKGVILSPPDGYTLLASAFNTAVMPLVLKAADFDPETDLDVIARTAIAPLVCVMTGARPEKTLAEVIAAAKSKPSDWNIAISSMGSAGHLATIEFLRRVGVDLTLVPYKGTSPALTDLMGGQVQLLIDPSFALLPATKDGKVRALGIATGKRSALAPDVPTMTEAGLAGYEFNSWYAVWAPKGLPADIRSKLHGLIQDMLKSDAVAADLTKRLIEPVLESTDDTKKFIRSEIVRAGTLLKSVKFEAQ
jgi:tripartite-type tricarboxylate transporter receptor subunit TctC